MFQLRDPLFLQVQIKILLDIRPPQNSKVLPHSFSSIQPAKLWAIYLVLQDFPQLPINIVSDSQYAVLSCLQLPHVSLPLTLNTVIDKLFYQIQQLLLQRSELIFFTHIHTHSALPKPLSSKNATIDALFYPIKAAKQKHLLQHTNSKGLQKSHAITQKQVQNIVLSCSICAPFALPFTPPSVNIKKQQTNQI